MQVLLKAGSPAEEHSCLVDGHVEHLGDRLATMADCQDFGFEPVALAALARRVEVFKKVHLEFLDAGSFAPLASPPLRIERKMSRRESVPQGLPLCRKQLSDVVEGLQIGDRV